MPWRWNVCNAALEGELRRRQEILHAAGGYANIDEYNKAAHGGW